MPYQRIGGGGSSSALFVLDPEASIVNGSSGLKVGALATDAEHGDRGGGSLHAIVVAGGAAGFMDGARASKLDGVPADVGAKVDAAQADIDAHEADHGNPHATTAAQVGADPSGTGSAAAASAVASIPVDGPAGTPSLRTLGTGAQQAASGADVRLSDARAPTGAAGGDLSGTYPAPSIAVGVVTDAKIATANKDGATGTPSMRTLGTGAAQACAGNDSRLSDSRAPSGAASGDLAGSYPAPTIAAGAVTLAKTAASLQSAAQGSESLRKIGTGTPAAIGTAAAGASVQAAAADHVHAHGNQAGGALHAVATSSTDGFMSAADKTAIRASMVRAGAGQSIAVGSVVVLDFDTVDFDSGSICDVTNNRFTVPASGVYLVSALFSLTFLLVAARVQLDLRVNGSVVATASSTGLISGSISVQICQLVTLTAGQTVDFGASHGAATVLSTLAGASAMRASICRMMPT